MKSIINPTILVQLSETEKRFIFVFLLALILVILIVCAIGYLICKVMENQGKKLGSACFDVCYYKVITNESDFKKYAFRKNLQMFIKEAWIPLIIILVGFATLLIRNLVYKDFAYNPFYHINAEGELDAFSSVIWLWKFEDPNCYSKFFGVTLLSKWPEVINTPHFVAKAWGGYVFVPCVVIGGLWYLITVQAFFARLFKTKKLAVSVFEKNLDNFNQLTGFSNGNPTPGSETNNNQNNNNPFMK